MQKILPKLSCIILSRRETRAPRSFGSSPGWNVLHRSGILRAMQCWHGVWRLHCDKKELTLLEKGRERRKEKVNRRLGGEQAHFLLSPVTLCAAERPSELKSQEQHQKRGKGKEWTPTKNELVASLMTRNHGRFP